MPSADLGFTSSTRGSGSSSGAGASSSSRSAPADDSVDDDEGDTQPHATLDELDGGRAAWLKAREAEGLDEGSPEAAAVRGALKTLEPLKRLCADLIMRSVCVQNVATILQAADTYQVLSLRQHCINFMVKNFAQAAKLSYA